MELGQGLDIDVTDAIAVGHQKCSVDMVLDPLDAPARLGVLTGIDEGDAPFCGRESDRPLAGLEIGIEVGDMTEIIAKYSLMT